MKENSINVIKHITIKFIILCIELDLQDSTQDMLRPDFDEWM